MGIISILDNKPKCSMNLLLLSSSKVGETDYLSHAIPLISEFLDSQNSAISNILFIPYAGVTIDYDDYQNRVSEALSPLNAKITSLHQYSTNDDGLLIKQIIEADCILVGGGNTFELLKKLYDLDILDTLNREIKSGKPYIGWSAGSNIAGESIKTTNDMPIVEPPSFNALNLIPYQLNPHYIESNPKGHNGETRQQRLEEYLVANPTGKVIAIPEGTALKCTDNSIVYIEGSQKNTSAYIFTAKGKESVVTQTNILPILENTSN